MRVAVVHSFYTRSQPSGENAAVERQVAVLQSGGHEVRLFAAEMDVERHEQLLFPVRTAARVATGRGRSPLKAIRAFDPDVVHVHNVFPLVARDAMARWDGALVATMHNYRPLCPSGDLFRAGQICTSCPDSGSTLPSVAHGCYHGSRVATVPAAVATRFGHDALLRRADVVVALTPQMIEVYRAAGTDVTSFEEVPNFVQAPSHLGPGGDGWVVAGRATPEKGIVDLVRAWPGEFPLTVVGPMPTSLPRESASSIRFLGQIPSDELRDLLAHSRGLVFPSRCMEGLALVCLEALSVGTPIIAWDPCPAAAHVRDLEVGHVGTDDLRATLRRAERHFGDLRPHCRSVYEERFTPQAWLRRTEDVYRLARERRAAATTTQTWH